MFVPIRHWVGRAVKYLQEVLPDDRTCRLAIKCPAPIRGPNRQWGDYYFAHSLKSAFEALGYRVRVDLRPDWYSSEASRDEVVVVLRGREKYEINSRQINLLWLISHPDIVCDTELEKFDYVFVASSSYSCTLASRLKVPVGELLQCSDNAVFYPPATNETAYSTEVLFVGNSRGEMRPAVADALAQKLPLSIFGHGWAKFLPADQIQAAHIPNSLLHKYYAHAKIVLNDQWPDMEREGFISNRIFDVALSGGFAISKDFKGADFFGEDLVTYRTPDELGELCRYYLTHEAERKEKAERMRQRTLSFYTFLHRARVMAEVTSNIRQTKSQ